MQIKCKHPFYFCSENLRIPVLSASRRMQTRGKLFSDSWWHSKCETVVLPVRIFQYSWHRLNIHVSNKGKFGDGPWLRKQVSSGFEDLGCPRLREAEDIFKKESFCQIVSDLWPRVSHANEHQRFAYFWKAELQERCILLISWSLWWESLRLNGRWQALDFLLWTNTGREELWSFQLDIIENIPKKNF